jgi:hypothetical protein
MLIFPWMFSEKVLQFLWKVYCSMDEGRVSSLSIVISCTNNCRTLLQPVLWIPASVHNPYIIVEKMAPETAVWIPYLQSVFL